MASVFIYERASMKTRIKEQGSATHLAIVVTLVVVIIGLLGFVFWQNFLNKEAKDGPKTSASQTTEVETSTLPESYTSDYGMFSLRYPADWKLATDVTDMGEASSLTSPSGTVLSLVAHGFGRGGSCSAEDGDVPFAAGNLCESWEYLSIEKLSIDNLYTRTNTPENYDTEKASAYLVEVKFGTTDGKISYILGLTSSWDKYFIDKSGPVMLSAYPVLYLSNTDEAGIAHPGIYIYASSETEGFLAGEDARTIKEIIRSVVINN
jgi:hypothetical protein